MSMNRTRLTWGQTMLTRCCRRRQSGNRDSPHHRGGSQPTSSRRSLASSIAPCGVERPRSAHPQDSPGTALVALVQPERAPRAGLCVPSGSSALDLATFSGLAARDRPLERGSIVRSRPRPPQTERAGGDHARAQPAHPLCCPRPQSCGRPARPAAFRPCRRSCRECARCRPALSGPSQRAKIRSEDMRRTLLGFPPAPPERRHGHRLPPLRTLRQGIASSRSTTRTSRQASSSCPC